MKILLLIIIFIGIPLVLLGKWTCARPFNRRKSLSDEELFTLFNFSILVDFQTWKRLMRLIGDCYSVRVEKLRPDDSFYGNLARLDSWNLGDGSEYLAEGLQKDFGVTLTFSEREKITTIQDLIEFIGKVGGKLGGNSGSVLNT